MLRAIAGLLGFLFPLAGAALALFVSGVEPQRPVSTVFVSKFGVIGLVLGLGFLAFAFLPRHKLTQSPLLRSLCIGGLGLPFIATLYLFLAASWPFKLIWGGVAVFCVACGVALLRHQEKYA
jgi:hypothetical protein